MVLISADLASELLEGWRSVPRFEGAYEVSDLGNVRSLDRHVMRGTQRCKIRGQAIRPQRDPSGVTRVSLSVDHNDRLFSVSRIVAEAFLPAFRSGLCVIHKDRDPANNAAANLKMATRVAAAASAQSVVGRARADQQPIDGELFRDVPGWCEYEISDRGRVRSKARQKLGTHGCLRSVPQRFVRLRSMTDRPYVRLTQDGVLGQLSVPALMGVVWLHNDDTDRMVAVQHEKCDDWSVDNLRLVSRSDIGKEAKRQ